MNDNQIPKTKGECVFCGKSYTKGGIARHLASCKARQKANEEAASSKKKPQPIYHIMAADRYSPFYWMHFEMPARTKLNVLDEFLRDIWLECCGHLSDFAIGGVEYSSAPPDLMGDFWGMPSKSMSVSLKNVLDVGDTFTHTYDYGTSTDLMLKVVSKREGVPHIGDDDPIYLMAKNNAPQIMCQNCNKNEATVVCSFCIYNPNEKGWLCSDCKTEHQCYKDEEDDYMFLPVVNSPRVGMCGYTGDVLEW